MVNRPLPFLICFKALLYPSVYFPDLTTSARRAAMDSVDFACLDFLGAIGRWWLSTVKKGCLFQTPLLYSRNHLWSQILAQLSMSMSMSIAWTWVKYKHDPRHPSSFGLSDHHQRHTRFHSYPFAWYLTCFGLLLLMSDVENEIKQPLSRLDRAADRSTQRLNELEGRLRAYEVGSLSWCCVRGELRCLQSRLELLLQNTKELVEEVAVKCDQLDVCLLFHWETVYWSGVRQPDGWSMTLWTTRSLPFTEIWRRLKLQSRSLRKSFPKNSVWLMGCWLSIIQDVNVYAPLLAFAFERTEADIGHSYAYSKTSSPG